MKLNVPLIRQESSDDCGLACLSMLMKYYDIDKSVTELKEDIKVYEGLGTYAPQLGKYLIENKFEVEIITMNPYLFTRQFGDKSQGELIKNFEDLHGKTKKDHQFKEQLRFFKEFMELGGKLNLKVPTINDIKGEISNKRPLNAVITSNFLLSDKAGFNLHFNIITGIDEEFIYVNDPLDNYKGGNQKYEINDFMYAIYASASGDLDSASIMKIIKKAKDLEERLSKE